MKKVIFSFSLIAIALIIMTGCNTISGVGRDVSNLGSDVSAGAHAVSKNL
ncbi:MAG: hypothetical protein ACH346_02215 [Chthoniobacterales bacterium]